MIWLCLICNVENEIEEHDYYNSQRSRYCSRCKTLDITAYRCDAARIDFIMDKCYKINEEIDKMPLSCEVTPRYEITGDFIARCYHILGFNVSYERIVDYIKSRIYFKSMDSWTHHRRRKSKRKYKTLIKNKISQIFDKRALRLIIEYL
jgi:hypothetical protein